MSGPLAQLLERLGSRSPIVTVIDLLLVYYLIYRLLLMIRGTRAAQMVVGIVLVVAAFFAADRLDLFTVSWLLDNVINYFIIIVIVVFQQDIRRALGRIGQGVLPTFRGPDAAPIVDEVVAAVGHMARARIGGIIVVERDGDIGSFVEDATPVDARLSRQLLVSLFVPVADNELHDGAVVIDRQRRIALARALLPLSRAALGPELGTRHRAALGITEDTDAVALVVSEERGEVSLCFRGQMTGDLDPATLRRALHALFGGQAGEVEAAIAVGEAMASLRERPLTSREAP